MSDQRTVTEAMLEEGIRQIRNYYGRFSVQLHDGRMGTGASVPEALENAKAGQCDLTRVAA